MILNKFTDEKNGFEVRNENISADSVRFFLPSEILINYINQLLYTIISGICFENLQLEDIFDFECC